MAQGQRLSDRQIETIRLAYAETGSQREAARRAGCSPSSAKRYVADPGDELTQLRTEKKRDIIEEITSVRLKLLTAMGSDEKVAKASMSELATSFGILTDKHQLMTGKATSRIEQNNSLAPWSDDEVSSLAALAERHKSGELVS